MTSAAQLVAQEIEQALSARAPAPFSARVHSNERRSFGDSALDRLSCGGAPVGAITELVGPESSGHTTAALSLMQSFVHGGGVCAWVDVSDALSPESVAASGIDLQRLLWVRCGLSQPQPSAAACEAPQNRCKPAEARLQPRHTGGGSPHPRSEGRDMPEAITKMLQAHGGLYDKQVRRERRSIATPGAPNRTVSQPLQDREEHVNSDRLPPRRGDNLAVVPRCSEPLPRRVAGACDSRTPLSLSGMTNGRAATTSTLWQSLDQALRATDLLLQNGGFGAIVLDLGSVAPEFAWRIPLATWFRFRAACERTRTSLVVLTQHPCARSSAGLVLRLQQARCETQSCETQSCETQNCEAQNCEAQNRVMTGILYHAELERSRFSEAHAPVISIRKPPQPEHPGRWRSEAVWA